MKKFKFALDTVLSYKEQVLGVLQGEHAEAVARVRAQEELLEKLREIDDLKARLAELNETLGRTPEGPACPSCGEAAQEGDQFCRACGEKLN